jgi:hypothetical protein
MLRALIFALALLAPAVAQAAWREASTPHFLIYSEENAATLQAFATRLEKFDKAMRMMRGMDDPPVGPANRLTIYVVPSVASVQRVMGRDGRNLAGVYIPRATGSIAIVPRKTGGTGAYALNAETVLLHEYAHHFMFANAFVAYPAWFVEGFAEFNSTTKFEKDGSLGFGLPAAPRLRADDAEVPGGDAARFGRFQPFAGSHRGILRPRLAAHPLSDL